jgi:NTP pyrophosphatase (non-canonical NTP hydrolase)
MVNMDKNNETLLITQEECAEVAQAISKCFRFGMDNIKPGKPKTNREHLEEELGDLLAMIGILIEKGVVNRENVYAASEKKIEKLKEWSTVFEKENKDKWTSFFMNPNTSYES